MYSRIVRNIFSASTKFTKQTINKNAKLIFPTSLTVPKLPACSSQYSVQNYSSDRESIDKRLLNEDLSNKQLNDDDNEYDSNNHEEFNEEDNSVDSKNYKIYFNERDQQKLDTLLKENPELEKMKKIIQLEITVLQQDGECVPTMLKPREWIEVLSLKSKSQRRKYYKYLFINEKIVEKRKKQKEERQFHLKKVREERKNAAPSDEIQYGFSENFMLRRINNTYINNQLQWNSLRAIMFGNKLVFDCSYEDYMSNMETKSCAKQLNESYAINRIHNYPFEIFLTNVNKSSRVMEALHRYIPILYDDDFPFTVTEKSYLELFDRSKLCYLSSNAPTTLEEYDPETIYIIGAYVDKGSKKRVSFGKAKREGIRMAKLPLDKYLQFGASGGKDLTLNQVCNIMLDSQCKSWSEALKHVPTRKLQESRIRALENRIRSSNMRNQFSDHHGQFSDHRERVSYNSNKSSDYNISSSEVHDFSNSARVKLRERWNK